MESLTALNLFIFSLSAVCALIYAAKYELSSIELPEDEGYEVFTKEDMKKFDGSSEELPIYMGVRGVVFDVSKGKGFYGKEGPYNALVGKDSTRGVAKMSLKEEDLTHDITGLKDSTLKSLDKTFKSTYLRKYPVVGYMDYFVAEKMANKDTRGKEEL